MFDACFLFFFVAAEDAPLFWWGGFPGNAFRQAWGARVCLANFEDSRLLCRGLFASRERARREGLGGYGGDGGSRQTNKKRRE